MELYTISYILAFLAFIIVIVAQLFVSSSYSKYSKVSNTGKLSGKDAARKILDKNGLSNVQVVETSGRLTDHYDPRSKVIRLSSDIYNGTSIASVSVASHECGHAIQDKENYSFLRIRASLVPIVNFSSYAGYFAILFGFLFSSPKLIWLGILAEVVILLFQFVTLPVEINASKRALKEIENMNLLMDDENRKAKTMLAAAASTYVASVLSTLLELFRLILIFRNNDN